MSEEELIRNRPQRTHTIKGEGNIGKIILKELYNSRSVMLHVT